MPLHPLWECERSPGVDTTNDTACAHYMQCGLPDQFFYVFLTKNEKQVTEKEFERRTYSP